jgi:hypothetical protein
MLTKKLKEQAAAAPPIYPSCEVCDSGGIAANDCPNCHFKLFQYYEDMIKHLTNSLGIKETLLK